MKILVALILVTLTLALVSCNNSKGTPQEFLMWSMDQHKNLKSFAAKGDWNMKIGEADAPPQNRAILYIAPNKFKVESGDPHSFSSMTVSDGKSLAEYSTDPKQPPVGEAAPESISKVDTPFLTNPVYEGSPLYLMFAGRGGFGRLVDVSKGPVEYGKEVNLNGEKGQEVNFYAKGDFGHVSMLIGEKTGLVHWIQFDSEPLVKSYLASDLGQKMDAKSREQFSHQQITESYTTVAANPDLSKEPFEAKVPADILSSMSGFVPGQFIGKPAPNFSITGLDGKVVHLSDFKGKPVMIDFWATWCGPCQLTLPKTQAVYEKHKNDGIVMAISNEKPDLIRSFLKAKKLDLPVYVDSDDTVATLFKIDPLPSFILIDKTGKVVDYQGGYNEAAYKSALAKAGLD